MNTEQFTALMELVRETGEGAWILALVYLLKGYFVTVILAGTGLLCVTQIVKVIRSRFASEQLLLFLRGIGYGWTWWSNDRLVTLEKLIEAGREKGGRQ